MYRFSRFLKYGRVGSPRFISSAGNLDGRVAIVTAGTDGIGLAIAKRLGQHGAHVVVSSRKQKNIDRAVDELNSIGIKVLGIPCDVADSEQRQNLIERTMKDLGSINIFVQNAGVNPHLFNIMETPGSVLDKTYGLHIKANFQIVQEIFPHMAKSKHQGSIILTSSVSGYTTQHLPGAYGITKASISAMVRAFMSELLNRNIRINCLAFGGIDTSFLQKLRQNEPFTKNILSLIPMKRLGTVDECAGLASYLASDDASYVTGETFVISGGSYNRP
uniref:tropinone reductase-like 3 n=1 Tax=Styela clava TaxID=7725 RepID=UPI0019393F17|nr:tropinone reductase-like 3 [Styela clava]